MSQLKPMVRVAVTLNGETLLAYARDEGERFWCAFDNGSAFSVPRDCVSVAHGVAPDRPAGTTKER